jgi:DNA-binding MarR family transcriptional regulator
MARDDDQTLTPLEGTTADGELAPGMALDDFPPYLLNRIVNRLNTNLSENLKDIGITIQQYRILAVLMAGNHRTVSELAVYTVTEQSTLSKMLDRMEEAGLVERQADSGDGRVVNISITEAGYDAYAQILPIAWRHYRRALHGVSDTDEAMLVEMLHKILENVRLSSFP